MLRGDRRGTGLAVICRLGVAAVVRWVGLLGVVGEGLSQSGLKTLNIWLLIYLLNLAAWFKQHGISTLIGPQLPGEKCIWGVVVVAVVHCWQARVVTIDWVWCRGLASWGEASPCIVGRVWTDAVECVCCLYRVSIH